MRGEVRGSFFFLYSLAKIRSEGKEFVWKRKSKRVSVPWREDGDVETDRDDDVRQCKSEREMMSGGVSGMEGGERTE